MNGNQTENKEMQKEFYYHIRIWIKPLMQNGYYLYSFDNKGEQGLNLIIDDYFTPYIKGETFVINGKKLNLAEIDHIHIFKSERSYFERREEVIAQAQARWQSFNEEQFRRNFLNNSANITNDIYHKVNERFKKEANNQNQLNGEKSPLLFISHSTEDYDSCFVKELIKLLETIGLNQSNMFCSSHPSYWIKDGDIYDALLSKFVNHNIFVLFVQSPRFFNSPISLNEMGAAWVLKTKYWSILTNDFGFDDMRGVANDSKITIKVDNDKARYRLNDLKDCILEFFGLDDVDSNTWDYSKDNFLDSVRRIPIERPFKLIEAPKFHHSK